MLSTSDNTARVGGVVKNSGEFHSCPADLGRHNQNHFLFPQPVGSVIWLERE